MLNSKEWLISNTYSRDELLALGFTSVGKEVIVSKDARLYSIQGKLGDRVRIDAFAILTGHIEIGNDVHISPFSFLGGTGGGIFMSDNSGVSTHVSIFTKGDDYTSLSNKDRQKVSGPVHIGRGSIVGSGSKIFPQVTIGDGVNIGTHCVINQNINSNLIVVSRSIGIVPVSGQ